MKRLTALVMVLALGTLAGCGSNSGSTHGAANRQPASTERSAKVAALSKCVTAWNSPANHTGQFIYQYSSVTPLVLQFSEGRCAMAFPPSASESAGQVWVETGAAFDNLAVAASSAGLGPSELQGALMLTERLWRAAESSSNAALLQDGTLAPTAGAAIFAVNVAAPIRTGSGGSSTNGAAQDRATSTEATPTTSTESTETTPTTSSEASRSGATHMSPCSTGEESISGVAVKVGVSEGVSCEQAHGVMEVLFSKGRTPGYGPAMNQKFVILSFACSGESEPPRGTFPYPTQRWRCVKGNVTTVAKIVQ